VPAKKQKQPLKKQSSIKEPLKKKEQTKKKAKEPAKLPWEKTYEEAKKAVEEHFKPKKPKKKVPINLADSAFFKK
jgi:vacuolar-type H+-ATPase subunit H